VNYICSTVAAELIYLSAEEFLTRKWFI